MKHTPTIMSTISQSHMKSSAIVKHVLMPFKEIYLFYIRVTNTNIQRECLEHCKQLKVKFVIIWAHRAYGCMRLIRLHYCYNGSK